MTSTLATALKPSAATGGVMMAEVLFDGVLLIRLWLPRSLRSLAHERQHKEAAPVASTERGPSTSSTKVGKVSNVRLQTKPE